MGGTPSHHPFEGYFYVFSMYFSLQTMHFLGTFKPSYDYIPNPQTSPVTRGCQRRRADRFWGVARMWLRDWTKNSWMDLFSMDLASGNLTWLWDLPVKNSDFSVAMFN